MLTLKQKAIRFRNAINQAKKRGALDWHSTFSKFPDDCCDMTCDLLGQYLLESGIETYQINGINKHDSSWHHVWLVTNDGVIIDITGDQFVGKILNESDVDPVHVGREGIVHKLFCMKQEREENTRFVDPRDYTGFGGRPSFRQERLIRLDNAIRKYL